MSDQPGAGQKGGRTPVEGEAQWALERPSVRPDTEWTDTGLSEGSPRTAPPPNPAPDAMREALQRIIRYPWDDKDSDDAKIITELAHTALSREAMIDAVRKALIEECESVIRKWWAENHPPVMKKNALLEKAIAEIRSLTGAKP